VSKTEVSQFGFVIFENEDVFQFNVVMRNVLFTVTVFESTYDFLELTTEETNVQSAGVKFLNKRKQV